MSGVARIVLDPVQDVDSRDFRGDAAQDWALLVLEQPIVREAGFVPIELADMRKVQGRSIMLAGYFGLRRQVLTVAEDLGPLGFDPVSGVLVARCSAMFGDSGAPLLVMDDDGARVVGSLSSVVVGQKATLRIRPPVASFRDALRRETGD